MLLNCGVGEDSWESLGWESHSKGNQPWIFTGRTDAEVEAPILCPPDAKNWLTGKDPDAGKDWRQEEKGKAEYEMVRDHNQLNGCEFQQTLGDSETGVREHLTGGFLRAVFYLSRILCSLSVPIPGMSRAARSSQKWDQARSSQNMISEIMIKCICLNSFL